MSAVVATSVTLPEEIGTLSNKEREHPVCPLDDSQKQILQDTWKHVEPVEKLQQVGILLFHRIFEIAPEAIALFPKFRDVPAEKREEDSAFRDHSLKVVEAIGLAVSFLGDTDTLETVLQDLGSVHVTHGLQDVHFEIVGKALVWTLEYLFGSDFTGDVEKAWKTFYTYVADHMKIGLHKAYAIQEQAAQD